MLSLVSFAYADSVQVDMAQGTATNQDCGDQCFIPSIAYIKVGDTITWQNKDSAAHTATANDGSFDTSIVMAGQSASSTFNSVGSYQYICIVHPWMKGVIVVSNTNQTPSNSIPSLSISVDSSIYDEGDTVTFSGFIKSPDINNIIDVTVRVMGPLINGTTTNIVKIIQVKPYSDGSFDGGFVITSLLWDKKGDYKIVANYGPQKAETTFFYNGGTTPSDVVAPPPTCAAGQIVVNGQCANPEDIETPYLEPIIVVTDEDYYNDGDIIAISGLVRERLSGYDVTFQLISSNGDLVTAQQLPVSDDNTFGIELATGGPLWRSAGTYTVKVLYGTASRTAETTFEFMLETESGDQLKPSNIPSAYYDNASPILGNPNAPITIIEFGDYQCFYCNKFFHEIEDKINENYIKSGKVKMIFKDFTIIGSDSVVAANAAHCAEEQNMFWQYHDMLYNNWNGENNGWASLENQLKFAQELDLDMDRFSDCITTKKYYSKIGASNTDAESLGLTGTPTFFIIDSNNKIAKISGVQSYDEFVKILDPSKTSEWPTSYSETVSIPRDASTPACADTNRCFIPYEVEIATGGTVTWVNADTAAHTATSGMPNDGSDGVFDSSIIMSGGKFSHKFDTAGTYDYFCIVHPWMKGIVIVGQGTPNPTPTPDIDLAVDVDKSEYDLGEMATLNVGISGTSSPQNVAITVTDPFGIVMVSRTLTTDSNGNASTNFNIAESFKTGTYRIDATSSINGRTYSDTFTFRVTSQFNQIQIMSAQGTDQQGNPMEFSRGSMGFVKVQVNAQKPIATLITVNVFDTELTPLGVGSLKTTLNTGQSEMILSFMIPEDAVVGTADIYVNALSDWVSAGGIPQTGEFAGQVRIN